MIKLIIINLKNLDNYFLFFPKIRLADVDKNEKV